MPVPGLDGAVHHQQVPIMDIGSRHGIPNHAEEESGNLVADQIGIEIERGLRVSVSRGRKPGRDAVLQQGQQTGGGIRCSPLQGRQENTCTAGGERNYCSHGEQLFLDGCQYKDKA